MNDNKYEINYIIKDGKMIYILKCPKCNKIGVIDDDQYHGRVSVLHDVCGFHKTIDFSKRAKL